MPKTIKGKCVFNTKLKSAYPFLETTKHESVVFCRKCKSEFPIASGGKSDIARHLKTSKHLSALNAASTSQKIDSFFPSTFDAAIAAIEGTWAYHGVNANHSFKSSDCASKNFRTCFKMKSFACSQKKCQAIIVNVFAPKVTKMLNEHLDECSYVSVYTDASNHGNVKIFPVLVRYFIPTIGVQVKVMEIESTSGETSQIIEDLITETAVKFRVKEKIVAYCGDNAKVNFGGVTRGGQNNVFARMKSWLPHLIGIGCTAHILHNLLKSACDVLPFDVECVVVKIYSYFYIYTTHEEALKSFCEEADIEYLKLLGYAKTRFLALGPAIKRILHLFEPLKKTSSRIEKRRNTTERIFQQSIVEVLVVLCSRTGNKYEIILLVDRSSTFFSFVDSRLG